MISLNKDAKCKVVKMQSGSADAHFCIMYMISVVELMNKRKAGDGWHHPSHLAL